MDCRKNDGPRRDGLSGWLVILGLICFTGSLHAQIPEQYPPPLIHTPANHPADRVLIADIDGMNAVDLANWVKSHPESALTSLSRRGVTYTNAHVPWPDSAAGMLAFATGGSPISTGIISSHGFDRALSPGGPGCAATGAELNLDLSPPILPSDPERDCAELTPHALTKVNSIFDMVHAGGGRTAWAGDNAAYADLLRGPSGTALDDAFVPEPSPSLKNSIESAKFADEARVGALLGWIDGKPEVVPRLFGITLMSLDAAQRSLETQTDHTGQTGNAVDSAVQQAFEQIDKQLGLIVAELKKTGLDGSTWIVVTAAHGRAPSGATVPIDPARIQAVAQLSAHKDLALVTADAVGLVWLKRPSALAAVLQAYRAQMTELGIGEIYSGEKLRLIMNSADEDSRMPDLILQPQAGVIWMRKGDEGPKMHGGFSDEQNHVALLVSGRQLTGRVDKTLVPTTQIAPLILRILGMEKMDLRALHQEHTPALPGIF
jgi:arylsulfatase A-like enzyme